VDWAHEPVCGPAAQAGRVINRLVEKERDLRYQPAADLHADLKRLRPDSTRQPSAPFQSMKVARLTSTGKVRDSVISPDGNYISYLQDRCGAAEPLDAPSRHRG